MVHEVLLMCDAALPREDGPHFTHLAAGAAREATAAAATCNARVEAMRTVAAKQGAPVATSATRTSKRKG